MDRLIVVYKKIREEAVDKLTDDKSGLNSIVMKGDLSGLLICNSDEAKDEYIAKFDADDYESAVVESERDIDALRGAYHLIAGWDTEKDSFVINGTEEQLIHTVMNSKIQTLERKYSTNRILRGVLLGEDEWAKGQLMIGEEKMQDIRDKYNQRLEEYNKIVAAEQDTKRVEGDYGDIT